MRRFSSSLIGIDQGTLLLFSHFESGEPMWTGNGPREVRRAVGFSESFLEAPVVSVGISLWDLDQTSNSRADLSAQNVTEQGFELVFRTWSDTRVARVRADWMAFGAVRDEDMWDVD